MTDFSLFFTEGIRHITDWKGYDHILFIAALCLPYQLNNWRRILVLVTAFTIGHSVTLALSIYNKILVSSEWIEFLIPLTIIIAAIQNMMIKNFDRTGSKLKYASALLFGLIHGMGFSNYLRSMMGKDENIITELLAFNIGLEVGQLIIVCAVLLTGFIFVNLLKTPRKAWLLIVSGAIVVLSVIMTIKRIPSP